jgi:uncharacterized membrane protein YphA (DoxX/SURF4 family)
MRNLLLLSLRVLLGAVFLVSGFQKLTAPYQNFAAVIEKFEVLRGPSVVLAAQTLPWAEFILGVFLILGLWERLSLVALWVMNTVFIAILAAALARKLPIQNCGCFGEAISLSLPQILWIDISLWILFLVYFSSSQNMNLPGLDRASRPRH